MKVLLTGATGFVGSHILDRLRAQGIATAVLLRPTSSKAFIAEHLPQVSVRFGSITDPESIHAALQDATHVIHCAGCTKAVRVSEFYAVNHQGTRHLVAAIQRQGNRIQRLVHISSLAASRPARADAPAREEDPPSPVSEYSQSKLAGECEVKEGCRTEFVILRPSAVYGPRDTDFLLLFKALQRHVFPSFGGGRQAISLVHAKDLAAAAVACLTHPAAAGRTYNVASPEALTVRELAGEIARQMKVWTLPLPLPLSFLWPACLAQEALSRLTGRPSILSCQKYGELRAPGWVCDTARLRDELGFVAATALRSGIAETLDWYRREQWL
ncbi:MAG: NAD(P)-dependent oxidoreductase [Verrucomicrobiota bacterium]